MAGPKQGVGKSTEFWKRCQPSKGTCSGNPPDGRVCGSLPAVCVGLPTPLEILGKRLPGFRMRRLTIMELGTWQCRGWRTQGVHESQLIVNTSGSPRRPVRANLYHVPSPFLGGGKGMVRWYYQEDAGSC